MDKALLYFIRVMDHITVKEYALVYFDTLSGEDNHLDCNFLKKLYDVDIKCKRNLKALYFIHPTFHSKVSTWFIPTFSVSGLKDKIHHVGSLQQLFSAISPEQIDFPPFVLEYDARVSACPPLPGVVCRCAAAAGVSIWVCHGAAGVSLCVSCYMPTMKAASQSFCLITCRYTPVCSVC